jgi:cytochrome P450
MISDPGALQHILSNPHKFKLGLNLEILVSLVYGEGSVICVSGTCSTLQRTSLDVLVGVFSGENHKRLRAALNTGFSAAAVRTYLPVFEKAAQKVR